MSDKVSHINDSDFDVEVLKSITPVLVDFWAPWCGPCLAVAPELEALAMQLEGRLKVVKVNVDENKNSASQFDVMSIPTMILFKAGQVAKKMVGAMSAEQIRKAIESEL